MPESPTQKYLVFADAHKTDSRKYMELLPVATRERVGEIVFLGDIDTADGHHGLWKLRQAATRAGIRVRLIVGNHDVPWHSSLYLPNAPHLLFRDKTPYEPELACQIEDNLAQLEVAIQSEDRLHFRHALAPYMMDPIDLALHPRAEPAQHVNFTDDNLKALLQAGLPVPKAVRRNFWMLIKNSDPALLRNKFRRSVFRFMEQAGIDILFHGHDHRGPEVVGYNHETNQLSSSYLRQNQTFVLPSPGLVRLPDFAVPNNDVPPNNYWFALLQKEKQQWQITPKVLNT